ncbi:hypothetical protein PIB30_036959 [Stylosanthes scabra]|uniref:Uncharacterized protein n=1 Tax=Stylosanthes scabra TaxID=79078 RepID=A0ABU6VGG3_9FABA|nr:hypothetical protein [Stylosanthes scabra]
MSTRGIRSQCSRTTCSSSLTDSTISSATSRPKRQRILLESLSASLGAVRMSQGSRLSMFVEVSGHNWLSRARNDTNIAEHGCRRDRDAANPYDSQQSDKCIGTSSIH